MMGTRLRDFAPLPNLSLEELVPKDNFYRRLQSVLDLSFVGDLVEDLYAACGRPSVDPVVFFKQDWHGMRRFRLRRLEKVNIEALLIASGQNVKRLLAFGGHRPKKLAQAAALRLPTTPGHEISRTWKKHLARRTWRPTRVFFNRLHRYGHLQ